MKGRLILESVRGTTVESNYSIIKDNIRYIKADDPLAENMFMRIGADGLTSLYRAKDQDVYFDNTNTNAFLIQEVPTELVVVQVNGYDVLPSDGSYLISFQVSNTSRLGREVTIDIKLNGTILNSATAVIPANATGYLISISNYLNTTITDGSTVSVDIYADNKNDVRINGDVHASRIRITKALAAPVTITKTESSISIHLQGNKPKENEIITALNNTGIIAPFKDGKFFAKDQHNKFWVIFYLKQDDKFIFEKLTKAN